MTEQFKDNEIPEYCTDLKKFEKLEKSLFDLVQGSRILTMMNTPIEIEKPFDEELEGVRRRHRDFCNKKTGAIMTP